MRRIRYISPVESMSGNLSGNRKLQYANNNNPAYEAPDGQQTARNYIPRFIASERKRTGQQLFSVKTKSTTVLDPASRRRMAAMAFSQAFQDAGQIRNAWPLAVITQAQQIYNAAKQSDSTLTWRKFWSKPIYDMLVNRRNSMTAIGLANGSTVTVTVNNPFIQNAAEPKFTIWDTENMVKFWLQLSYGMYFKVSGLTGIAYTRQSFAELAADETMNVLGISIVTAAGEDQDAVKIGDQYVNFGEGEDEVTAQKTQLIQSPAELEYHLSTEFKGFGG